MSPEQEKAITDDLRKEHAAAVKARNLLRAKLESTGNRLVGLGRLLIERPTELVDAFDVDGAPNPLFDQINELVGYLRKAEADATRLKQRLAAVGVHVD